MNNKNDLTKYVDKLYLVAMGKVGDSHIAEELVQETCLAALQMFSKGQEPDNLWGWLNRVITNKYYDWLREKYNKPQISFESYMYDIPDERAVDEDASEQMEAIRRELGYLVKTHREVMVRFYMHGESVEQISKELQIPIGTVKSRLSTGRKHIKEGVGNMENYAKQSYEPEVLKLAMSGWTGFNEEPFSLVKDNDRLTQNILILAYAKPTTETEIAKALGVSVAFIEPIVETLVNGELMKRSGGGKIHTDFIIYTDKDKKATFKQQLDIVDKHFQLFWKETEKALSELREQGYYKRQAEHERVKLELYFCIKLLLNAHITVRDEVTGKMPFSEYPYRKNGGRWLAMGFRYPNEEECMKNTELAEYGIGGEGKSLVKNFGDTKLVEMHKYDTGLGRCSNCYFKAEYIMWLYEIFTDKAREESSVAEYVLESAEELIRQGILRKAGKLDLDIPVLSKEEYENLCKTVKKYEQDLSTDIREALLPVFEKGYVRLPTHLKDVPKWQQYMLCGDSVPMAVIYKAIENGLLFENVDYKIPAAILVVEK